MAIDSVSSATAASSAQSANTSASATASVGGSDFETFLRMLTVQMQNQDPLNPIDSSDYAVQLATFSGVEQQVRTNDLLSNMGGESSLSGLSNLAGWVGMEARIAHTDVTFDGTAQELHFTRSPQAKTTELVVKTPAGQEIQRIDVSAETSPYLWTGSASQGGQLLTGSYQIEVVQTDSSGSQKTTPVETYAKVSEVRAGASGTEVVLTDGRTLPTSEVTALRAP